MPTCRSDSVEQILSTFQVVADTREQNTRAKTRRFDSFGVPVQRATLKYGDYCGNVILPNGKQLYDVSKTLSPSFVIERKMSLDELESCFTSGRSRFQREFERARDAGATMILLVENGSWEAILSHRYRSRMNPAAFIASLVTWSIRYKFGIIFCRQEVSGKMIREFLYRDMKERLERGVIGDME